jgi:hypothetical protein
MAWKNVGPIVTLAPGASVTWAYSWVGYADHGVQIAHAFPGAFATDVEPPAFGTAIASDQGIEVRGLNQVSYRVRITNIHPTWAVRHNLQGGQAS